jgi:hypothetical protein
MANTLKEKELKTDWPHEEGLIAETTTQTGRKMQLEATEGTFVPRRKRVGL